MLNAMCKPKLKKKNMNYDVHIEDADGFTQVMILVIHIIDLLYKQNAGLFSIA